MSPCLAALTLPSSPNLIAFDAENTFERLVRSLHDAGTDLSFALVERSHGRYESDTVKGQICLNFVPVLLVHAPVQSAAALSSAFLLEVSSILFCAHVRPHRAETRTLDRTRIQNR